MELSSPVASLVLSLVLNAVVTFGGLLFWLAAIPFRRVPVFARLGPPSFGSGETTMARKRKKQTKTNNAVLPVMRPDAAGIDVGATEMFCSSTGGPRG